MLNRVGATAEIMQRQPQSMASHGSVTAGPEVQRLRQWQPRPYDPAAKLDAIIYGSNGSNGVRPLDEVFGATKKDIADFKFQRYYRPDGTRALKPGDVREPVKETRWQQWNRATNTSGR
mmetsp:Transcript_100281/g.178288  ORF Transcript_100281/g.178288 Transcript_100281/m.178288 type:complete len:119 (-) Transcript_100281:33-389(-)